MAWLKVAPNVGRSRSRLQVIGRADEIITDSVFSGRNTVPFY